MRSERIAIFLLSASIIGFQLGLISILSYSQWHHFAYLAVSIAMLGFGSSGVILSLWADFFQKNAQAFILWLTIACGVMMLLSPLLINLEWFRFDTFLLFTSTSHIFKLLLTCFILFIPFLLGATVIGLFFMVRNHSIPMLYAWNLAGSAAGGLLLVVLSSYLFPMNLTSGFGLLAILSGSLLTKETRKLLVFCLLGLLGIAVLVMQPSIPSTSEFKSLTKTLLIPETDVVKRLPLPLGTLEMVESHNIRQANGLGLSYTGSVPLSDIAFINAQPYLSIQKGEVDSQFYYNNLFATQFIIDSSKNSRVLFLQPSSTFFPSQAISLGAKNITIIEPVKPIIKLLINHNWENSIIKVENSYPREFLNQDKKLWDQIVFPTVGSAGGAGLSALKEQYVFTSNATEKAIGKLSENGMLVLSSFMDTPPRYSLKLITLAVNSLKNMGLNPSERLVAIRNWNTLLLLLKPTSFTEFELSTISTFCFQQGFDLVHPPSENEFNLLGDTTFQVLSGEIIEKGFTKKASSYIFNISPPSDNSPFFSQFMRVGQIRNYLQWYGAEGVPFLELGYLIVWASLFICLLLALIAIASPLFISLRSRKFSATIWIYFSLLGLGYMLIETVLIQKSILALGNPITASAIIIASILCFSAIGSYYCSQLEPSKTILWVLLSISIFIFAFSLCSENILSLMVSINYYLSIIVLVLSIAPLSLLMGMSFPLGMKILSKNFPSQIPIAWGVNGFFSVLAAPIATIIAVEKGFLLVFILSSFLYFTCIPVIHLFLRKTK